MKKVAAITFHRAHNYGSVLQAYALKQVVESLYRENEEAVDYSVIDYYSQVQEDLYRVYRPMNSAKALVKNAVAFPHGKQLKTKHRKFMEFVAENLNLTKRYWTPMELQADPPQADIYISGSDQIWNVRAQDFSPAYYFSFLPDEEKRVSYAASLGPLPIDWEKYDAAGCKEWLEKYAAVSVREAGSQKNLAAISEKETSVHVDPTLLLTADLWREIQSDANYRDGQYILLYCLEPTMEQLAMADAISKKLNLPILILRYNNKNDMFNHFVKKYDAGPRDFLAYIDHAALVLSSSFHGTAFSLIYHKPFYSFHGMEDNRIRAILEKTKMEERSLASMEDIARVTLDGPNADAIEALLEEERSLSKAYLRQAMEIG